MATPSSTKCPTTASVITAFAAALSLITSFTSMSPSTIEGVLRDIMCYNCVFYNHTVYANIVCNDDINKSIVDDSVLYDFAFCGTMVCSSVLYICMPYQHLLSYCICCGCAFGA